MYADYPTCSFKQKNFITIPITKQILIKVDRIGLKVVLHFYIHNV
jgi:hypothetical protein